MGGQAIQGSKTRTDPAEGARGPALDFVCLRCPHEKQEGAQVNSKDRWHPFLFFRGTLKVLRPKGSVPEDRPSVQWERPPSMITTESWGPGF